MYTGFFCSFCEELFNFILSERRLHVLHVAVLLPFAMSYKQEKRSDAYIHLSRTVTPKDLVILHWTSLRVGCVELGLKWSLVTILAGLFFFVCASLGEPNKHFTASTRSSWRTTSSQRKFRIKSSLARKPKCSARNHHTIDPIHKGVSLFLSYTYKHEINTMNSLHHVKEHPKISHFLQFESHSSKIFKVRAI